MEWITVLGIVITGIFSTVVAIINSNSRAAATEQKFKDDFEVIKTEQTAIKKRLNELSETDSCCVALKEDVKKIMENITDISATLNQFKATSDEFDNKLKEGFVALASDSIEQAHRYYMQKGYITESSKKSVHVVYDSYKSFGGNGYEESNINDIDALPVKS